MSGSAALNPENIRFENLSRIRQPSIRLFCFPYAGGSADVYRNWQSWFPEQVDVCLAHLPGHGRSTGQKAFTRLAPMVQALADRIGHQIEVPYVLYGHSMGALISFELARELLRRNGAGPNHLIVSGRRAPQCAKDEQKTFDLPYEDFVAELKRLNGTPREVLENPELMELFTAVIRADFEVVEEYEYSPGERLPCPITVYGGLDDKDVSAESCHAWREQTSAGCKVRMFRGDHFFIRNLEPDFVAAFRSDVLSALTRPCGREV